MAGTPLPVEQKVDRDRTTEEEAHPGKHQGGDQRQGGGDPTAGSDRRSVEEQDGEQAAEHRAHETNLKGPYDVFRATAQKKEEQHCAQGEQRSRPPPNDREQQKGAARM